MTEAPYGAWRSPINASQMAAGGRSLAAPSINEHGIFYLEGRPLEGGRNVLVHHSPDGSRQDVSPEGFNVRTGVHEYGGGAYVVERSTVFFANFADQRLYRQELNADGSWTAPRAITDSADARYADLRLTPDGRLLFCVRETHGDNVVNEIAVVDPDGSFGEGDEISGADFFAAPRISPDGTRLAHIDWHHPQMPWDGTRLWLADLLPDGGLRKPRVVAGSESESVIQPEFSPDGTLHYLSDRTGWWNLYDEHGTALAPMDAEVGGPMWGLDPSWYAFTEDGRTAFVARASGLDKLYVLEDGKPREIETAFSSLNGIRAHGSMLVAVAASPSHPSQVVTIDADTCDVRTIARSRDHIPDERYLSAPRPVEFPTTGGRTAHALYYPPRNDDFTAPAGERPPLVVFSHGGPTGATTSTLNLTIQFFTSRGIAVVDVNYGGSTGYGREYRDRLKGTWGVTDVDDCTNAALWLAEQGLADPARLAIRGGSAGGYTTLSTLAFRDAFACGASYYGVADAGALARDTHKFESRYLDGLIGPWPEAEALYRERSALFHADRITCPVIFFQGLDDKVVPPNQAEAMVAALAERGVPHAYLAFEGEQHGFRKAETISRTIEAELWFYANVLGFPTADEIAPVDLRGGAVLPPRS